MIISPRRGVVKDENLIVAAISIVSASIFREGGAPKFLADNRNHQIVITGNRFIMPLSSIRFRLCAVS